MTTNQPTERVTAKDPHKCRITGKDGYVPEEDCHCFCCGTHDGKKDPATTHEWLIESMKDQGLLLCTFDYGGNNEYMLQVPKTLIEQIEQRKEEEVLRHIAAGQYKSKLSLLFAERIKEVEQRALKEYADALIEKAYDYDERGKGDKEDCKVDINTIERLRDNRMKEQSGERR